METESLKGRLLVATPVMEDPNFARTVVLVLEHTEEGALGVVLNRPGDGEVSEALPGWGGLAAHPAVVFFGGPVAPGAAVCIGRAKATPPADGWEPLFASLGTVDVSRSPDDLVAGLDQVRVFSGYAGWGPGQLESELEVDAWIVVDADPDDALSPSPERLWSFVLRRQGGKLAMLANFPPDPSSN